MKLFVGAPLSVVDNKFVRLERHHDTALKSSCKVSTWTINCWKIRLVRAGPKIASKKFLCVVVPGFDHPINHLISCLDE